MMNEDNFEVLFPVALQEVDFSQTYVTTEQQTTSETSNPFVYAIENPASLLALAGLVAVSLVFRKKVIDSPGPWLKDK